MGVLDIPSKLTRASLAAQAVDPDHVIERALLAAIVESSDDAIVSKTLDGRIQSWNAAASRIFGYTAEEAIGQPITLIIPPELHAEEREILAKIRRGERIEHFETTRLTKDGQRICVSLTVSPIRDSTGAVIGASKIARDISERARTEEALRQSAEALRDADRRKDEFLALLAHELRNPLAPIRYALAATRKAGRTAEQQKRAEEIIERQVAHMSRLLDDLLDMSRITRGMLELKKSRTELTVVIGSAVEAARPVLDAKHHAFALALPSEAVRLDADPVRLAQVFSNLLINAAKYTDPGGHIELRAVTDDQEVVVTVKDDGIGISADMMPRLFTLFAQAYTALDRSEGGLGVGLALVRGLVSLHGGSIEARSDGPGRGSEFIVRLPIGTPQAPGRESEPARTETVAGAPLRIVVADDSRDAADSCATLLELSGHRVWTAYTGERAFELVREHRPQVVLLDIGLPDVNGYELVRRIRSCPWGHDMALVAITGWGQEEDRRRAFDAGFDRHLTKPLAADAMETLLSELAAPK